MTAREDAIAKAIKHNHPSAQHLKFSVSASAEVVAQEPGVTDHLPPSVTLGELSSTVDELDGLVARLRLLKGGKR